MNKRLKQILSKEDTQIANKQINEYSTLFIILKIKTTRSTTHPIECPKSKWLTSKW